ncbi:hypothetical protein PCO31110_01624 [Pandoraea communis]|uniref:Uncharacterized protein n=1 Tax=Pandoraea communis TaxID=2508297 RepID=A0A5E4TV39_9BURK|nr:hypothetical protein [Pandoraea communis]VVD91102.1 hypothetical protein PCO31110_01624 [Pandoraea communis]
MNAPLPCVATQDLGEYLRQQDAADLLAAARERAAESADAINALQRLLDENYGAYCELQNALIRQDAKRAGEIMSSAFEAEISVFIEEEVRE